MPGVILIYGVEFTREEFMKLIPHEETKKCPSDDDDEDDKDYEDEVITDFMDLWCIPIIGGKAVVEKGWYCHDRNIFYWNESQKVPLNKMEEDPIYLKYHKMKSVINYDNEFYLNREYIEIDSQIQKADELMEIFTPPCCAKNNHMLFYIGIIEKISNNGTRDMFNKPLPFQKICFDRKIPQINLFEGKEVKTFISFDDCIYCN